MLIQHPAVLSENIVSLYFFLLPQRCRISHRRQCASLLHWNLTIQPSLWPDRELRKYHCPCLALTPPPVAIRHLLLRNRYRPDGLHGVQSKARPNRNVPEEWVFSFQGTFGLSSLQSKFNKNPPVSRWPRRRTLVVLAGLHMVCFDFFSVLCSRIGAKKIPRWFPNEASKTILSHTTSHHASEDLFYKIRLFFSRTLKLIICSFCMNNQHFNFWSSNDIYHVNFLLICFTQSKFLSARIQNPYHRNLLIESFP